MDIIPAIDLIGGQCVRLIQGDYGKQINYEPDPVKQAIQFISEGAEWLHIVDLEGAKAGRPVNTKAIAAIARPGKLKIEVGGGIRTEQAITELLELGIERVIIGTKAVEESEWFGEMARKFAGRIVLGLDARGEKVSSRGWTKSASQSLLDFAVAAAKLPIAAIIYTDITRDGMLEGPNIERTRELIDAVSVPVVASGGVTTVEQIRELASLGAAGAIVGRALYEGSITLQAAIEAARTAQ